MTEAPGRDDAGRQPDPDVDTWSAWLPDLDRGEPSTTAGARAGAEPPADTTPPPPDRGPQATLPQAPLPQAGPPLPQASPPLPQASRPLPQSSGPFPFPSWPSQPATARAVPGFQPATAPGPSSHLVLALVSLFAFFPLGILAVVFALSSLAHRAAGRQARARAAGRAARTWAIVAIAVIPVLSLVATLLFVAVG